MIEFLQLESPLYLWIGVIAVYMLIDAYSSNRRAKKSYEDGFATGKADLNREILRAENKGFVNGYEKAKKDLAISKPPVKQTTNPAAKKVAPKPAAKKPVKKAVKGK